MHRIFRVKAYEMEHGPHFNEEHARKAVMKIQKSTINLNAKAKENTILMMNIAVVVDLLAISDINKNQF